MGSVSFYTFRGFTKLTGGRYYAIQICVPNSWYLCASLQLRKCRDIYLSCSEHKCERHSKYIFKQTDQLFGNINISLKIYYCWIDWTFVMRKNMRKIHFRNVSKSNYSREKTDQHSFCTELVSINKSTKAINNRSINQSLCSNSNLNCLGI